MTTRPTTALPKTIFWPGEADAIERVSGNRPERVLGDDQVGAILRIRDELLGDPDDGFTGSVLVGAEMGSGKTVVIVEAMLAVVDHLGGPTASRVLLVGPRDVDDQWFDAIEAQSFQTLSRGNQLYKIDTTRAGARNLTDLIAGSKPGIYFAGLEILRSRGAEGRYKAMPPLDLLVFDEVHRHSNRAAEGTKVMRQLPALRRIALSGTFFGNKFENAHTVARSLWPEARDATGQWIVEPSLNAWLARYGRVERVVSKSGRLVKNPRTRQPIMKVTGERNPGEFVKGLPCYVFLKSPVGDPPPPKRVLVKMSGEQERQYREMERQSLAWLTSSTGASEPLVADLPIVQRIRLRTAALGEMSLVPGDLVTGDPDSIEFLPGSRSNKLNALGRLLLEDPEWIGERVLILTHSRRFADEAARRIAQKFPPVGGMPVVVQKTGSTKAREWKGPGGIKERFMLPLGEPGAAQFLIATYQAIGTGTDELQFRCRRVVMLSRDENNTNNIQGLNRIWRRGVDTEGYRSVEFVSGNSIDEEIELRTDVHRKQTLASIRGGGEGQ